MKAHLIVATDPLDWFLRPPVMYGLCSAEVVDAERVDSWTVTEYLPEFNSITQCAKCIAIAKERRPLVPDGSDEAPAAKYYVYAIAPRQQHDGKTIARLEKTVDKVAG